MIDIIFSTEKEEMMYFQGIIAVSLAAGQSFDERTDDISRMTTSPSLILIWSFVDPIQPKVNTPISFHLQNIFSFSYIWKLRMIFNALNSVLQILMSSLVDVSMDRLLCGISKNMKIALKIHVEIIVIRIYLL